MLNNDMECARQLVLKPYILSAAERRAFKFSLCPEFENLVQLFFGTYKSAGIVFCVVFIIVRLFNTFDTIDICVLCVWHDSIEEIYIYSNIERKKNSQYLYCYASNQKTPSQSMDSWITSSDPKWEINVGKIGPPSIHPFNWQRSLMVISGFFQ